MRPGIVPIDARRVLSDRQIRALPPSLRAILLDVWCQAKLSETPGVFTCSLGELARALPGPINIDQLRKLAEGKHIEGSDAGGQSPPLVHTDRQRRQRELIPAREGPLWFVRWIVVDEHLRGRASEHGRKGGAQRQEALRRPRTPLRVCDTHKGTHKASLFEPPPPAPSPPHTPPLTPPPAPTPFASANGAEAASPPSSPSRKAKSRHETLSEHAPYRQFISFWCDQKRLENPAYVFVREDGVHLSDVWHRSGQDLLRAKAAVAEYMRDGYHEGHPAKGLRANAEKYLTRASNPRSSTNGKRSSEASRGFCPQSLPIAADVYR